MIWIQSDEIGDFSLFFSTVCTYLFRAITQWNTNCLLSATVSHFRRFHEQARQTYDPRQLSPLEEFLAFHMSVALGWSWGSPVVSSNQCSWAMRGIVVGSDRSFPGQHHCSKQSVQLTCSKLVAPKSESASVRAFFKVQPRIVYIFILELPLYKAGRLDQPERGIICSVDICSVEQ